MCHIQKLTHVHNLFLAHKPFNTTITNPQSEMELFSLWMENKKFERSTAMLAYNRNYLAACSGRPNTTRVMHAAGYGGVGGGGDEGGARVFPRVQVRSEITAGFI